MEHNSFTIKQLGEDRLALCVRRYRDGSNNTAVQIVSASDDKDVYATISVNVPEVRLPEGEFVFKTYLENEGLFEQLRIAGIIEETGRMVRVGMAGLQPVCRVR